MYKCKPINKKAVESIAPRLISAKQLDNLHALYGVFADRTRLKIINCLLHAKLCVCDIAVLVGCSHSLASHQLKRLKAINVVDVEEQGNLKLYSLKDEHIEKIFMMGMEHIDE
mgnify:CR=1 FL=1